METGSSEDRAEAVRTAVERLQAENVKLREARLEQAEAVDRAVEVGRLKEAVWLRETRPGMWAQFPRPPSAPSTRWRPKWAGNETRHWSARAGFGPKSIFL